MNKPLNLIVEESKEIIINTINKTNLPPFLLETIIKDIYMEIVELKKQELEKAKIEYAESLKESSKDKVTDENVKD